MRLTKRQLKLIFEQYLYEKEGEESKEETEKPKENDQKEKEKLTDFKSFKVEVDDKTSEVKFFIDKQTNELQYKVDGQVLGNKSKESFMTLAALGMLQTDNKEQKEKLFNVVKLNKEFSNVSLNRAIELIKQKMNTERIGFRVEDIRKALGK